MATDEMWPILQKAFVAVLGLMAVSAPAGAHAAPPARFEEPWLASNPESMRKIDQSVWAAFLRRYVRIGPDNINRVAYGQVTPADRQALDDYLLQLSKIAISTYNRAEQLAYWINLYNALIVRTVLRNYPVESILDISPGASTTGPWAAPMIEVEGQALSLGDIQNGILRPIWNDPRILYALSCGALSCPNLRPEPFTSDRLSHQLSEAAIAFVNDPRCIRLEDRKLIVSSLFRWYREDFGGSDGAVIHYLMGVAEPDLAMKLEHFDRIDGDVFDWRLNDATAS
jgi:hypothetical protein